uniref:F-box associated beta-propeller type 1 domain-containing protein n=1 Tax=Arundo donax TaxID=35708 RepID=A0A0A8XV55_ARUDO
MSCNINRSPVVARHFTNVSGIGRPFINPSLSFLPRPHRYYFNILDCCNGLLLCRCPKLAVPRTYEYVVCNPATEKWVVLPQSTCSTNWPIAHLGFEPAVSSHFHVFEFEKDEDGCVTGVQIYLSKTGIWSQKDSGWSFEVRIWDGSRSIFFNGMLHLVTFEDAVATVDVEAKTWRIIPMPYNKDCYPFTDIDVAFIDLAQGRLCLTTMIANNVSIWVLENYSSEEWILKHSHIYRQLFWTDSLDSEHSCSLVSICPEGDTIFLVVGDEKMLRAYKMDRRVFLPVMHMLGHDCQGPYLPYVPDFSESLTGGH